MARSEILIVGINSFLGKAIYELTKTKHAIVGIYNNNKENIPAGIETLHIDAINTLKGRDFSQIYLISSYVPGAGEKGDDQKLTEVNVLLPRAISELFPGSRIVFCSSVSVYENVSGGEKISRINNPMPQSKYALSKLWGERIIENHPSFAIIRISSMYGVGMKAITFIPRIIGNAILKGEIILQGLGNRMQNYIHVGDVADIAVRAAGLSENITLLAVNDSSYSNKNIAEMILEIIPGKLSFSGEDYSKSSLYDNAATHAAVGRIEFKDIKRGLRELVEWSTKKF